VQELVTEACKLLVLLRLLFMSGNNILNKIFPIMKSESFCEYRRKSREGKNLSLRVDSSEIDIDQSTFFKILKGIRS